MIPRCIISCQKMRGVCRAAWRAYEKGFCELAQRKIGPGNYKYLAQKRREVRLWVPVGQICDIISTQQLGETRWVRLYQASQSNRILTSGVLEQKPIPTATTRHNAGRS